LIPESFDLDPTTGLHVTGTAQEIDLEDYRLVITGTVDYALRLTYDDLRCMPRVETRCTLVCPGFFEDEGTWAGVPLIHVLEKAGMRSEAIGLRLVGADGYASLVSMDMARDECNFLAYEWEGEPLPILHGFPVRAVFPESSGNFWVKWLVMIEVY
jgi:DMSO/TMAO reductase YedYZ molybdopterin-dependent catalytic subunit